MEFAKKNLILYFVIALFIISLIPMLVINCYNHPSSDDIVFSQKTLETYTQTNSVFKTINTAVKIAKDYYYSWQGSFLSIVLMTLQPAIWGQNGYMLTAIVLLVAFIFSNLFFSKKLLINIAKLDYKSWLIISVFIIAFSIQLVPSPLSAFYWYNGAIYYCFTYSLMLIYFGLVIGIIQGKRVYINMVLASLIVFVIGASNYVTALLTCVITTMIILFTLIKKKKSAYLFGLLILILITVMMISILAPGNEVRQELHNSMHPIKAIAMSIMYGVIYITMTARPWVVAPFSTILFCLALVLFTYMFIRNTKFKFKYPLLVMVISLLLLSMQFTPTLYGQSDGGPLRLKNIIYFSYVWLLFINMVYSLGWLIKRIEKLCKCDRKDFYSTLDGVYKKSVVPMFFGLFIAGSLLIGIDLPNTTSVSAAMSLVGGEAQTYHNEYVDRVEKIAKEGVGAQLTPYSVEPYVLFYEDDYESEGYKKALEKYGMFYDFE